MRIFDGLELLLGIIMFLGGAAFSWYYFDANMGIISVFGLVFVIAGIITIFETLYRNLKIYQRVKRKKKNRVRWEGEPIEKISLRACTTWIAATITIIFLIAKEF